MKFEFLEERWYKFKRVYFKEGFIDVYQGDSSKNPNHDFETNYSLNNTITLYRLNGEGYWYNGNFMKSLFDFIHSEDYTELYTSDEIWEQSLINVVRRMSGTNSNVAKKVVDITDWSLEEDELAEELFNNLRKQPFNKTKGHY